MIDKIVKSKRAPKDKKVLWDDGVNLKINRNGVWENVVQAGGDSSLEERLTLIEKQLKEVLTNE